MRASPVRAFVPGPDNLGSLTFTFAGCSTFSASSRTYLPVQRGASRFATAGTKPARGLPCKSVFSIDKTTWSASLGPGCQEDSGAQESAVYKGLLWKDLSVRANT